MAREKLIRTLRPGEIIQVTDATGPIARTARVKITHVQEIRAGIATGRRMWQASFTPAQSYGGWATITGYSDSRITVYGREEGVTL